MNHHNLNESWLNTVNNSVTTVQALSNIGIRFFWNDAPQIRELWNGFNQSNDAFNKLSRVVRRVAGNETVD